MTSLPAPWLRALVQTRAVMLKEIRQTVQDRRVLFLLLVAPFLQLVIFGFAINLDVDRVQTVIVDQDGRPEGRQLVQRMLADGTLQEAGREGTPEEAARWLDDGRAAAVVVVPHGFARAMARQEPAALQVLLDGSDPTRSGVAAGAVGRFLGGEAMAVAEQRVRAATGGARGLPMVEVRPRLLFNPALSSPVYMIPGIAGMLLLIVTTIVTSMGLAREREMGTLEQVRVTPLPTIVLMVGKLTPYIAVGLFDVTAAITAGALLFDLPIRGSLLTFYTITSLYLLTTVGVGLLISTLAETQQQAFLGGFLFILPAMLLSGTLTPIHAMPEWMQPLTLVNPLRFYMEAVRAILLKGASLGDLLPQATALAVYGFGIVGLAASRFRMRMS